MTPSGLDRVENLLLDGGDGELMEGGDGNLLDGVDGDLLVGGGDGDLLVHGLRGGGGGGNLPVVDDDGARAVFSITRHRDEPSLRWRRAKLGRKHCSQDEADWASEPAAAWEPPIDLHAEKMDLLEEIMEEGIQFCFSYSTIGYGREICDRQLPAT